MYTLLKTRLKVFKGLQSFRKSNFGATHGLPVHEDADSSSNFAGKQDNQAAEELQDRTKTKDGSWKK